MPTSFKDLADLCETLEGLRKRVSMVKIVANFLKRLEPDEVEPAVSMILGRAFPKHSCQTLETNWATLSEIVKRVTGADWTTFITAFSKTGDIGSAVKEVFENRRIVRQTSLLPEKALTITEVRQCFETIANIAGYGSKEKRERLIENLLISATPAEAKQLVKIIIGEMRTGFNEGLMEKTVSEAFQIPLENIKNASMMLGDIGAAAAIAKKEGLEALSKLGFKVFRPVKLMLAQMSSSVAEALEEHGGKTAFEYKLDGVRVQIHKKDENVKIYSRRLTDATESLPEIAEAVKKNFKAAEAILEGEVIAVDRGNNPVPFQHLMRRFRRVHLIEDMAKTIPVKLYLFDVLYLNGESLTTLPYLKRRQILAENAENIPLTKQIITDNVEEAEKFLKEATNYGHEGLIAKKIDSEYTPGIRGKRWLKIKPTLEPLDLVIIAAEYGYGRRHKWLSDYYLAARDAETGNFLTVGKTFKGLTDMEIVEMTKRLKELAVKEEHRTVHVIPRIVVEVAYNEIQKSPKYKCGMALRFARITRIREDKTPYEADTIQRIKQIYENQFLKKGNIRLQNM
ncbi:MAG: ATP-dependent DNA ligase [Candidatus Bathyarchaeia archaeon]